MLLAPLLYRSGIFPGQICVPTHFKTDLASIPWLVQPIFGFLRVGRYDRAAVVHDWLYATQWLPRALCDRILREAMQTDGVGFWTRWAIWAGVRVGGSFAWRKDSRQVRFFRRLR